MWWCLHSTYLHIIYLTWLGKICASLVNIFTWTVVLYFLPKTKNKVPLLLTHCTLLHILYTASLTTGFSPVPFFLWFSVPTWSLPLSPGLYICVYALYAQKFVLVLVCISVYVCIYVSSMCVCCTFACTSRHILKQVTLMCMENYACSCVCVCIFICS